MNGQTIMSGMPDLYAEDRKRLVLIVEDEYVNRELLKACLEITDIKYSEKKVSFNVRNLSTIPITLTKAPGGEKLTYPRLLYINEKEELSISINGTDSRKPIGLDEFDVNFAVANWYTDVDTPLVVSYHFVMPEKYRKQ